MKPTKFELTSGLLGLERLVLDGLDVTDQVSAAQVQNRPGQPTTLLIQMAGEGTIAGEGIVYVERSSDLLRKIKEIDPKEITQEALNRMQWGDESTLTDVVLKIILERIDGT